MAVWRRASLQREAHLDGLMATAYRRMQVATDASTPEGEQEAADWRLRADIAERHSMRSGQEASRPWPLRRPVREPEYPPED